MPRIGAPISAWTYTVGLAGTCAVLWFAALAIPQQFGGEASLGWLWWAPVTYLSAWLVLVCPSLSRAIIGSFALAVAGAVLAVGGFLASALTFFTLIGPMIAIVGCAFALGQITALVHAAVAPLGDIGAWRYIHSRGGQYAGVGLLVSSFFALGSDGPGASEGAVWSLARIACFGAVAGLGFAWHAVEAYRRLQSEQGTVVPTRRVLVLLAVAYLAPAVAFWWANPDRVALAWPVDFREAVAERKAAAAAEENFWGTRKGATLPEDARVAVSAGAERLWVSAPPGWLIRAYGRDHTRDAQGFVLRPDPAAGPRRTLVSRVEVGGEPWPDLAVTPYTLRGEPGPETRWRLYDCGPAGNGGAALWLCWQVNRKEAWKSFTPVIGSPPDTGTVRVSIRPERVLGTVIALGAGFRADCLRVTLCRAEFRFNGVTASADFNPEDLDSWPTLRRKADDLLRAATGRGIDDVAAFRQPEGDVLPFAVP